MTTRSGDVRQPRGRSRRRRRTALAGASAVLALLAGLTLAATAGDEGTAAAGAALPPEQFPEPGVVHVHGLGVDPADETLYAATHSGLFRIGEDGEAARVANRYQDTMGFEVPGGRTFAVIHSPT